VANTASTVPFWISVSRVSTVVATSSTVLSPAWPVM